jgi:pyruvate kinase
MKKHDLLCTIGPASLNKRVLKQLEKLDVTLFRINLSHTKIDDVAETIQFIQDHSVVPVCLDTEGAQVRTANNFPKDIELLENSFIKISLDYVIGNFSELNLYPRHIVQQIEIGDFINIDFNSAMGQVVEKNQDGVVLRILNSGQIGKNKAVTIQKNILLPPLTEKDVEAVSIGLDMGVRHFALSFANKANDIDLLREITGDEAFIISKIESRNGLENLDEIAAVSDALLIDRGDLSREVPIEKIPATQRKITKRANKLGIKLYVATNLLESMVEKPFPTRAEVNDIYNTLLQGANGLVLAAETAIGKFPVECAKMIDSVIKEFNIDELNLKNNFSIKANDWLIEPHGGKLVLCNANDEDLEKIGKLKIVKVDSNIISDCQMIGTGLFSPIDGFMNRETLKCVLNKNQLPEGDVWTMPILLPVEKMIADGVMIGEEIELQSPDGNTVAILDIKDIFQYDLDKLSKEWFGTTSNKHPGIDRIQKLGDHFLAGPIKLVTRLTNKYEMTPTQCRFVFDCKGWRHVVAFHTRNIPHRAHEYIMLDALESTNADGLFINPVFGSKKTGDFLSSAIMKSYQVLIQSGVFPEGKSILGSFSSYSRYAGPREAVFTALCRKNMGCDYLIVGRDHTGVGDYYEKDSVKRFFDTVGEIGISPVFFETIGFDIENKKYLPLDSSTTLESLSGTRFRKALIERKNVPDWLVQASIQDVLLSMVDKGEKIFCE